MRPTAKIPLRIVKWVWLLSIGGLVFGAFLSWSVGSKLSAPANSPVQIPSNLNAEEVLIHGDSEIAGSFIRGRDRSGVVLLLHGIRGNRSAFVDHARFLHKSGFSVLMIDLRAHGQSPGTNITFGKLESRDAQAAVAYLRQRLPDEKIGIIGSSLGGAAAVFANPALPVNALILEMVYKDVRSAVANRIAIVLGDWARPFSVLLTCQLKSRLGISASELSPIEAMRKLNTPKLIIGGSQDRHTLKRDTEDLFAAAAEPKELWILEGAQHQNLHRFGGAEYEKRIIEFLSRHLQPSNVKTPDSNPPTP